MTMTETVWLPDGSGGEVALDVIYDAEHAAALKNAVGDLLPRVEKNSDDLSRLVCAMARIYFRNFDSVDDPDTAEDESVSPWWKRLFGR